MAERIVSPGVFTREKDLSFLPQGISEIGAVIIGPTIEGPAFKPTIVRNFQEFEQTFGTTSKDYYTPYAVEQYLRSAGTVTIVRIVGTTGYSKSNVVELKLGSTSTAAQAVGSVTITGISEWDDFYLTGSDGVTTFTAVDPTALGNLTDSPGVRYFVTGSTLGASTASLFNEIKDAISNLDVTGITFTSQSAGIFEFSASAVGTAGNSYGFQSGSTITTLAGGADETGLKTVAVLVPSLGAGASDLSGTTIDGNWASASLVISGSSGLTAVTKTISFNTSSANYIEDVLSRDPQTKKVGTDTAGAYLYKNFKSCQSAGAFDGETSASLSYGTLDLEFTTLTDASTEDNLAASTPFIQSQMVGGGRYELFKVWTRSHGSDVNKKFKIAILNVKPASEVAGSDYGTFSIQVRQISQITWKERDDVVLEQYDNLTFNPTSTNYFARRIGDRFTTIDSAGKLTHRGDWPNMSKYIRVDDYNTSTNKVSDAPKTAVPMGYGAVTNPLSSTLMPTASFVTQQVNTTTNEFDSNVFYGYDFYNYDNREYLSPVDESGAVGSNITMSLENMLGHISASAADFAGSTTFSDATQSISLTLSNVKQRKFVVPFQKGFDRLNPATEKKTGGDIGSTNVMGFDCSSATADGTSAYKLAINTISNPDEYDINLVIIPGIAYNYHSSVANHAISKAEDRGDCFYVMDAANLTDTITTNYTAIQALDTNYAATYFPWVKIVDRNNSLPVWVPPSVVLGGTIAYTDKVAHEWFAPAGLNRGGLTTVLEAYTRLTHEERDILYENRVNPIASFPGQGVVVWGQKTLQAKPSALDRVNVRRLLIRLKKFIASSSRYLVFEQNNSATRARFLNIVNPFLESVQANSGLTAFRVVMDDTNNTPDVVDRNKLVGQIFIQPTRTAEFIVLDFVVLPTGATFPA